MIGQMLVDELVTFLFFISLGMNEVVDGADWYAIFFFLHK